MPKSAPDWYSSMAMHGKHGVNYVTVAVDAAGNILSLMQGDFGGVPATIAVDAAGRMIANLGAQDLPFLQIRPFYTELASVAGNNNCISGVWTELTAHLGQGTLLGGYVDTRPGVNMGTANVKIEIDGVDVFQHSYNALEDFKFYSFNQYPVILTKYDKTNHEYCMAVAPNFNYETGFKVFFHHATGAPRMVVWKFFYNDVP